MKVRELVVHLQRANPDADVLLALQRRYPVEYEVHGIAIRSDLGQAANATPHGTHADDVLLVEGGWHGYGHRDAWDLARRG